MQQLTERQKRKNAMYQFELQAGPRFSFEVRERLTNYRFLLHDLSYQVDLTAMVLASSFDFYEYRLNRAAQRVELVICQRHNAALPVRCLELDTGNMYNPGAIPEHIDREQRKKRNREESRLFVSMLLAGIGTAYEELARMPERTRQRYLALREEYLKPRIGRPFAS